MIREITPPTSDHFLSHNTADGKIITAYGTWPNKSEPGKDYTYEEAQKVWNRDPKNFKFDALIFIWNANTGALLQTIRHADIPSPVRSRSFIMASVTADRDQIFMRIRDTIYVWSLETGTLERTIQIPFLELQHEPSFPISIEIYSKFAAPLVVKNNKIFSSGADGTIGVWDASSGELVDVLTGFLGIATSIDISGNSVVAIHKGNSIFARKSDRNFIVAWELQNRDRPPVQADLFPVILKYQRDKKIADELLEPKNKLWEKVSPVPTVPIFKEPDSSGWRQRRIYYKKATIFGDLVLVSLDSAGLTYSMELLDLRSGHTRKEFVPRGSTDAAVLGNKVFTATDNGVEAWDVQTGHKVHQFSVESEAFLTATKFTLAGDKLVSGTYGLNVWDVSSLEKLHTIHGGFLHKISSIASHGTTIAVAGESRDVILLDINTGKELQKIQLPEAIDDVYFSKAILASKRTRSSAVYLWDLEQNKPLPPIEETGNLIRSVALSGDKVVLGLGNNTVALWNAKTTERLVHKTFRKSEELSFPINTVTIHGSYIVACGDDSILRILQISDLSTVLSQQINSTHCNVDPTHPNLLRIVGSNGTSLEVLEVDIDPAQMRVIASTQQARQNRNPTVIRKIVSLEPTSKWKVTPHSPPTFFQRVKNFLKKLLQ